MNPLQIGRWSVDPADGTLRSPSEVVHLEPRVMAVLVFLVERRGRLVTHADLLNGVWRDAHVAPGAMARAISILRRVLGDDARNPTYIETVPKRGYRFVCPDAPLEPAAPASADEPTSAHRTRGWPRGLGAAAVLLAVLSVGDGDWPARGLAAPERLAPPTISNRGRTGNENSVAYYTRAVAIEPKSSEAAAGLATAYAFRADYLPDGQRWTATAIDLATRATTLDPTSSSAFKALGTAYLKAGQHSRAIAAYRRTLELFPGDDRTENNLGVALMETGRIAESLPLFEHRIARAPEDVLGYLNLADGLVRVGFPAEGLEVARRALVLEPYNHNAQMLFVRADLLEGGHEKARARLERQMEVDRGCVQCRVLLGLVAQVTGRTAEAERHYRGALEMSAGSIGGTLRLAQICRAGLRCADADGLLDRVAASARTALETRAEDSGPPWQLAAVAAVRGDKPEARRWFARAIEAGHRDVEWDRWDPLFESLRDDPGFLRQTDRSAGFPADRDAARPVAARIAETLAPLDRRFRQFLTEAANRPVDRPGWPDR